MPCILYILICNHRTLDKTCLQSGMALESYFFNFPFSSGHNNPSLAVFICFWNTVGPFCYFIWNIGLFFSPTVQKSCKEEVLEKLKGEI